MNKNLLIGVGVLAVVGVGGFLWYRSRQNAADTSEGGDTRSTSASEGGSTASAPAPELEPELPIDETLAPTADKSKKQVRKDRRQNRRDCRAEAKSQGLKGKAKREFKRECKAAGGINADFVGEEADFAFNGYSCFN
jgi:hypothetical protein